MLCAGMLIMDESRKKEMKGYEKETNSIGRA